MGCCNIDSVKYMVVPPEYEILKEVADKAPGIVNAFEIEHKKILNKRTEILKEREEKVEKAVKDKIEQKELNDLLLKYNLKEIDNEKDSIINEVDKMHNLYKLGLELSEKLKKVTLEQYEQYNNKLDKFPSVLKAQLKSRIEELNKTSPKDFLESEAGNRLKNALEKEGMREDKLKEFMDKLAEERQKRRVEERLKYKIEKNEFPPKDELHFTAKDLFKLIFEENTDEFKSVLTNKLMDNCL